MDFEADPINKIKPLIIKTFFQSQTQLNFLITQLKYCQKLDFEADLINKIKPFIIMTIFSDLKTN